MNEPTTDPRIALAIERTYLAWVRTGLAMMGFGFVVARFGVFLRELERARDAVPPPARGISLVMGTSLVALGTVVALYAAVRFHRGLANADAGRPVRPRKGVPTAIAVALALVGVSTVWYFVAFA